MDIFGFEVKASMFLKNPVLIVYFLDCIFFFHKKLQRELCELYFLVKYVVSSFSFSQAQQNHNTYTVLGKIPPCSVVSDSPESLVPY